MNSSQQRLSGLVFMVLLSSVGTSAFASDVPSTTGTFSKAVMAPKAAKIAIPQSPIAGRSDLLGLVRMREPNATVNRIAQWISPIAPMANPAIIFGQAAAMGFDFTKMTPGGNAALFVTTKASTNTTGIPQPGLSLLLPLAITNTLALPGVIASSYGKYSLLAKDQADLNAAIAKKESLYGVAQFPMMGDLDVSVNIKAVMAQYGTNIRKALKLFEGQMASSMNATNTPQLGAMQTAQLHAIISTEAQAGLDALNQLQDVTFSMDFTEDAVEFDALGEAVKGTKLASLFSGPSDTPDLMRFFPSDAAFQFQETVSNMKQLGDIYIKYAAMFAGPSKSNQVNSLKSIVVEAAKMGIFTKADAFGIGPDGKMQTECIILAEHPEVFMPFFQKQIESGKDVVLQSFYLDLGITMDVKNHVTSHKEGMRVESYDISINFTDATAKSNAVVQKFFGQIKLEAARLGPYILIVANKPIDTLAKRMQIDMLAKSASNPSAAMKEFPAGGALYVSCNIPTYMKILQATMPPELADKIPVLDPALPPVTMAGYFQDGKAYCRMRVPRSLVIAIVEAFRQKSQSAPIK